MHVLLSHATTRMQLLHKSGTACMEYFDFQSQSCSQSDSAWVLSINVDGNDINNEK